MFTPNPGILPDDLEVLIATPATGSSKTNVSVPPTTNIPTPGQESTKQKDNESKSIEDLQKLEQEKKAKEEADKKAKEQKGDSTGEKPVGTEQEEKNETELPIVVQIAEKLKYNYTDEELAALQDTPEELETLVTKVAEQKAVELYKQRIAEKPEVQDFLEYVEAGGDPTKYVEAINRSAYFTELKVLDEDVRTQKEVVAEYLRLKGFSDTEIQNEIKDFEDSGTLSAKAKRYDEVVKDFYNKQTKSIVEQQKQAKQQAELEAAESYRETVEAIKKAQTVKGLSIPEEKKSELVKFITPDKNGISPYVEMVNKFTTEDYIAVAYMVMNGFNLSGLIKNTVETQKSMSLVERYKASRNASNRSKELPVAGSAVEEVTTKPIILG